MLSESTATESEEKCFLLRDNCSTKDHCQYSMSPIKRGEKKRQCSNRTTSITKDCWHSFQNK